MNTEPFLRLALLYPGDRTARDHADPAASRFTALFDAFARAGVAAEPAVYDDDFRDEVWQQLLGVKGVLVWHNPIEGGRGRELLDAMLRDLATRGVFVSTHPDTILKLGTKDILMAVRDLPFGSDVHRIESLGQLAADLPERLASGARVLKQQRGQSGIGVQNQSVITTTTRPSRNLPTTDWRNAVGVRSGTSIPRLSAAPRSAPSVPVKSGQDAVAGRESAL